MNTASINAEVFYQLSLIADNENYLTRTLDFLKSLTFAQGRQKDEMRGIAYTTLLRQLSDFQEYTTGWDGEDASPLERSTVKNFKAVLNDSKDEDLQGWTISPETNGTLLLQSLTHNAAINIGNDAFSYYIKRGGKIEGENAVAFSSKSVLNIMRKVES